MSNEPDSERDELQLRAMLRTIDVDAAPLDRQALEDLRTRSAAEFAVGGPSQGVSPAIVETTTGETSITHPDARASVNDAAPQLVTPSKPLFNEPAGPLVRPELAFSRRSPMLTLAMRGVVAAAMSVAIIATWFATNVTKPASAAVVPFSKILDDLRGASSLELQLTQQGTASQILVRSPGLMRKNESAQRYEIVAGSRLWRIDEEANTVEEADSPWFSGRSFQLDLLGLMNLGVTDSSALLRAKPVDRIEFPFPVTAPAFPQSKDRTAAAPLNKSGAKSLRDCLVYRVELPSKQGQVRVEAYVNEADRRLIGIFAWPVGKPQNAGPPLAEIRLVAMNAAIADEEFQVAKSLTEDGRIGKVSQAQGIVVLRPMLAKRWTPIGCETVIKPGDWLRTELRGANAVKVLLSSDVELTMGPGTLVEYISPATVRVHGGVVQVQVGPKADPTEDPANVANPRDKDPNPKKAVEFTLLAPLDGSRVFKAGQKQLVRVDRSDKIVDVPLVPVWLAGFEGTTNNESLGSLIVNLPDGRSEPLTVGYHKVSIEIRDQIARTTVEESFVNHTKSQLEGVFHFPLPQDASISGFGMWIGNNLVEADVVEKQRAREIYETILRERRDPGLLEWTSGNIFKARVFPIEAHSEKRIKIVYTQMLPLRGSRYRYSYGLRSELLRTRPLRELSLTVTVNSALALKNVTCPTHSVRTQKTGHSAQVEFAAQEYTPTRDFEVVCEIDGQQSDVVIVPHRRGDDGYFLVQVTPPFQRDGVVSGQGTARLSELVPDGNPLQLVLLCDTSASMDSEKRKQQSEFVATVLSSLGPDDRFQVAACDVGTVWSSNLPLAPSDENVAATLKFLDDRISLGWTNLDRAFDDVLKRAPVGSQVVYIGDGLVSSGDTDPAAFVRRLEQRIGSVSKPKESGDSKTTPVDIHAVTVGNTSESVVLKGIASVGGGSIRAIGGEQTPQVAAREWMNEIAQPGLRDVNVEFRGFKVAAVYPGRLPNVPAGTQQILVGRYLPEEASGNKDLQGEVIVTGLRGAEKVKFAARVSLKNAEEGNSFIPRLWARAHLDQLLAQGQNAVVHDQIIRLSEEFHIITPFTSLLVLETDADRERFGVQRRYEMRDGEQFFAAGRDNANFELLQQQMKRSSDWRIGIRRDILKTLAKLGRNPGALQPQNRSSGMNPYSLSSDSSPYGGGGGRGGFIMDGPNTTATHFGSFSKDRIALGIDNFESFGDEFSSLGRMNVNGFLGDALPMSGEEWGLGAIQKSKELSDGELGEWNVAGGKSGGNSSFDLGYESDEVGSSFTRGLRRSNFGFENGRRVDLRAEQRDNWFDAAEGAFEPKSRPRLEKAAHFIDDSRSFGDRPQPPGAYYLAGEDQFFSTTGFAESNRGTYGRFKNIQRADYTSWTNTLFPAVESRPSKRPAVLKGPETWSPEALALAKSLLRTESLSKLEGGLEVRQESEILNPQWNRLSSRTTNLALYAPTGWMTRNLNHIEQTLVSYCTPTERGVYSLAFLLGRSRASDALELTYAPLGLADHSLAPIYQTFYTYAARVEPAGENRSKLILTHKDSSSEIIVTIDTARHVMLRYEHLQDGKSSSTITFDDFVEVGGTWWATKTVWFDDKARPTTETRLEIKFLTKDQYAERFNVELAAKPTVQFVRLPFVSLRVARQKVADGSAAFDDRLMMILHNAQLQQWDEMWKQVDAAEKLAADKPGVRWLRTMLQIAIRRNEEAQKRLTDEISRLIAAPVQDELFLAEFVLGQASAVATLPESYKWQQSLKPIYTRPFAERLPARINDQDGRERIARANAEIQRQIHQIWIDRETSYFEGMGRGEEALELQRTSAEAIPWEYYRQQTYAQKLANSGQFAAAHAWLRTALARPERIASEDEALRSAVADLYRQQTDWAGLLKWTTDWIAKNPDSSSYTSAYSQHLAAMIFNDKLDDAYLLADQWLKDARVEGKLTAVQRAKIETAINFANGQLYYINFQRMDERWFEPLAETARFFVRHQHHFDLVQRCVTNHYFTQSDTSDRLRGEWLMMLRTELEKLNHTQIGTLVGWTLSGRIELAEPLNGRKQLDASEVPAEIWSTIAKQLKARWELSKELSEKHSLSETLRTIYANRFADSQLLPFLRERLAASAPTYRRIYVTALFDALLTTKWTDEIEQEAFARWRDLSDSNELALQLSDQLPALMRLVDAMLANRIAAAETALNDQGGQDKLTRKELAAKKAEIRKAAQLGLSERLGTEAAKSLPPKPAEKPTERIFGLGDWLKMEQFWLDIPLNQNLAQVEAESWRILGDAPYPPVVEDDKNDKNDINNEDVDLDGHLAELRGQQSYFDAILRQRAFVTVMNLVVRKQAEIARGAKGVDDPALSIMKFIDAGIAGEERLKQGLQPEDQQSKVDFKSFWRMMKFRLLVALDRPDVLDQELRAWIRTDVSTGPWRQSLARLLAERGKIDEAIQLFEACLADKLLSSGDYKMLSDWYLVVNRRDAYERSRMEIYEQMPEGNLAQMIYQSYNRWHQPNIPLPSELDENTLFAFKALFKKSANPEHYLSHLQGVYMASRDFRLYQMMPDSLLGRSPQQVYPYLRSLRDYALNEMRNESTADEILAGVKLLREGKRTTTDLRALDLFEALVERKSSEVLNQPGIHVDRCLAAMRRAFDREWSDGELPLMSQYLYGLGGMTNEKLQAEQLREMRALQKMATVARQRMAITADLCQLIFWNYSRFDEGLHEMEAEVQAYLQANDGVWPHADNAILGQYVAMYEGANRHTAGEGILKKQIGHTANVDQKKWLDDRLMQLYNHALEHNGAVSIGTGRANLLQPIVDLTLKELEAAPDENVRYNLVARLNTTFDIASRHKLPGAVDAVKKFAFETMPGLLRKQQGQYRNTATTPLHSFGLVLSPKLVLQYIVERIEQWPQRLEVQYDNSWNAFGYVLPERRAAAGPTDLDDRVLKLVITRLQYELRTGDGGYNQIYYVHNQYFWKEKAADFAKAAEQILTERRGSGRRQMAVANYLRNGLGLQARAIEILLIAHGKGLLDEGSQYQLAVWLREANRYAEVIPILEPLVGVRPDNITYRTELFVAYFHNHRFEQMKDLIQQTDDHFHHGGRWTEGNVVALAQGCQNANQWEPARLYFTEAITLHQRSNPNSGINDSGLSDYYQRLATVESQLDHTKEAVTAASAAIVCWGAQHQQRQGSMSTLLIVLGQAKDLDDYVVYLDSESKKSGQDSQIIRKSIGTVYKGRNQHAKAIIQYKLAIELQPNDQETHQSLIQCYDAMKNKAEAVNQLLKLIDLHRHDLALYQQLAERLKDNEVEAERAATSIIESSPNESESHAAMAELREKQNRWSEAIPHWEQVSKLRKLEPTGLLRLAKAQLHEKQWSGAMESIQKLNKTDWPSRFNNVAVEVQQLDKQLPK